MLKSRLRAAPLAAAVTAVAYIAIVAGFRFRRAFLPYVAETDWKQALWPYYRYFVDGAFLPGHLLTDYAFTYHGQPLYWAIMAPLCHVLEPRLAANLVNIAVFFATAGAAYLAVRSRVGHLLGCGAAMLIARDPDFFRITAGGFQRSFGPLLVLAFLSAWLYGRRRLCLAILVVQAGIYPSVVLPCALAFGVWSVCQGPRAGYLRRLIELGVAGILVFLLARAQDLRAPEWWGSMVSIEEAQQMPVFFPGGRMVQLPLPAIAGTLWKQGLALFSASGPLLLPALAKWNAANRHIVELGLIVAAVLVLVARRVRYPIQIPLLFLTAFVSYMAARELAFKLFVPHRMLAHTWPYLLAVGIPIALGLAARTLLPQRQRLATGLAVGLALIPVFVLDGNGLARSASYRSYAKDKKLYEFVKHLPIGAQFAGNLQPLDELPLFSQRQVYVNWKMAHPFRKGYYAEIERRILKMYEAFYATDVKTILDFAEREKIDYLVVDRERFAKLEKGDGQLFEPLRTRVAPLFERGRGRFVLENPPAKAVIFRHRVYSVIDLRKLAAATGP